MIEDWAKRVGATVESSTPIDYGLQYRLKRGEDVAIVNVYQGKGGTKVVVQRNNALADELRVLAGQKKATASRWTSWCGSDESGKGDYFGPIAVAAVALTSAEAAGLAKLGVRDSKSMSDATGAALDREIRAKCLFTLVALEPEEYNAKHQEVGNVNRILGELHAQAIAGVRTKRKDLQAAVVDQFGDEAYVREALLRRGHELALIQHPRADVTDLAVGAASVVARAAFVRGLEKLEKEFKMRLPKGAGPETVAAAREFLRRHGQDRLGRVAKLHFKTTATL